MNGSLLHCPTEGCGVPLWTPPGILHHNALATIPERGHDLGGLVLDLVCEFRHTWALVAWNTESGERVGLQPRPAFAFYGEFVS